MSDWTFFSNHGHVLFLLCHEPDLRLRDVAAQVGITERAAQRIVHDLVDHGYLQIRKEGRRNHYSANLDAHLRHPLEAACTVRRMMAAIDGGTRGQTASNAPDDDA
jgi:DNA-binding IclR family transcriptional regulator